MRPEIGALAQEHNRFRNSMTRRQLDTLVRPVARELGLDPRRNMLVRLPVEDVVCGFSLNPSARDDGFYVSVFVLPLYVPIPLPHMHISEALPYATK